jgi:hypothetical protein
VKRRSAGVAAVAVAGGAALFVAQSRLRSPSGAGVPEEPQSRWRSVTVNRSAEEVSAGGEVAQLIVSLGGDVEVEVRPAPGDKGAELRARMRADGAPGEGSRRGAEYERDRIRQLRRALRETKQLIEVGEVLRVDPTPHGRRKATPLGALVEFATDRGPEEGLL